jgi:hypothetical protein
MRATSEIRTVVPFASPAATRFSFATIAGSELVIPLAATLGADIDTATFAAAKARMRIRDRSVRVRAATFFPAK